TQTRTVVERYFTAWLDRQEREVREVLADDLEVTTPQNAYRSAEPFVPALMRIGAMIRGIRRGSSGGGGDRAAALGEVDFPEPVGTLSAAWFLRVEGGKIRSIRQQYDATELRKIFGKATA